MASVILLPLVLTALGLPLVASLDNGVALTPPMGFLNWERFECNTNCDIDLDNCISERLFMQMADAIVEDGFREVGYQYVCIDDCWLAYARDDQGRLQPDPKRFPSGMKALADYVFPAMGRALNETGRHIVYSCEWPMYARAAGLKPDQPLIAQTCNMMRQFTDIYDSWDSVYGMISFFGDDPDNFSAVARPGAFNDPDQVVIGNFGLSHDQERVQMALFSILASPLLVSADFRKMRNSSKQILLNKRVIAISQDPLGIQGKRIKTKSKMSIWVKPVLPAGSAAVAFLYASQQGYPRKVNTTLTDLGLTNPAGYDITELFDGKELGFYKPKDTFGCVVNPTGVQLVKMVPRSAKQNAAPKGGRL